MCSDLTEHGEIIDGFGGVWPLCRPGCQLEIVRPGSVQCEACDKSAPEVGGWDESHVIPDDRLRDLVPRVDPDGASILSATTAALDEIKAARRVIVCASRFVDKIEAAVREIGLDGMVIVSPSPFVDESTVLVLGAGAFDLYADVLDARTG